MVAVHSPVPIQRVPTGLLDLLSSKASGDNPQQLAAEVQLALGDAADYYLAPRRVTVSGATAIAMTANGNFAAVGVLVPASELWLVYAVTGRLTSPTAGATALRYWVTFTRQSSSAFPIALTDSVSVGAVDNAAVTRCFERPAIFLPGDQFGFSTGAATGVPGATGTVIVDCARLTL